MKLKNKNESPILGKNMKYKHGVIKIKKKKYLIQRIKKLLKKVHEIRENKKNLK